MGRWKSVIGSPRLAASAVLTLGGLIIYLINFPGSMEWDSFVQLVEARNKSYSNWHPPVMSWMLGISDALPGPPAWGFVAFTMLLFFAALIGVVRLKRRVSWAVVFAGIVLLLLPQFFMLQAVVWKDTLFADAVLAGFVAVGFGARMWHRRAVRFAWLSGAALLFGLAVLTRQNGAVVVPCAAVALGLIVARRKRDWRQGTLYGAGLFLVTGLIAFLGNAALQLRADDYPAKQEQFKYLQLYDITGMVYRDLDMPLSVLAREAPRLEHLIRTEGVARWSPTKVDTLILSPRILAALDATPAPVVARQWREIIWHYPGRYLADRALVFRWVFQPPYVGLCHPFHIGDEGDPADLKVLGIQPRMDARDVMLWQIGDIFLKTPVFSHGLFSVVALAVLVPLLRRRRDSDIVISGLIISAFVFTTTFFLISIACDYRYLYLIDISALAGVLYVAGEWRDLLLRKRGPEGPL